MRGGRSFQVVWQTEIEVELERTKKKLRGVITPISTPNDYLDTVVDDVVSPSWSQKNASHGPLGKASTRWNTLPACEKSFRTRLQERPECYL